VTAPRVPGSACVVTERSVRSVVLWGLVILTIISILSCLPALHSATDTHHNGGAVDAFDLGVDVPKTGRGSLFVVLLGASFLVSLWH